MDLRSALNSIPEQISETLGLGSKSVVGLDIGLSSVKVAEMSETKQGEFKLEKFASVLLPEGAMIEDDIQKPDEIKDAIQEAFRLARISQKKICLGVYGPNTITKRLELATGSDEEIEDQVLWESDQYIPFGIENATISHHVYGTNTGGGVEVIMAAAKNDMTDAYDDLLKSIGLNVRIIDVKAFALANIFTYVEGANIEDAEEINLLVEFGAQYVTLILLKGEQILFTREINLGGILITEEIQRQFGVNYQGAEDLKTSGQAGEGTPEEVIEITEKYLETFSAEIQKSVSFFMTTSGENNLTKAFVTGGTSLLPGLLTSLEESLGCPTQYFQPFERVQFNKKNFTEEALTYIAVQGCVAMGLAMRRLK